MTTAIHKETQAQLKHRLNWWYHMFAEKAPRGSVAWQLFGEQVFHVLHHQMYGHFPKSGTAIGHGRIAGRNHDNPDDNLGELWLRAMGHANGKNSHLAHDVNDYSPERKGQWQPFSTFFDRIGKLGLEAGKAAQKKEHLRLEGKQIKKAGDEDGKPVEGDTFYQTVSDKPRKTQEHELTELSRSAGLWSEWTAREQIERESLLLAIGELDGNDKRIVDGLIDAEPHRKIGAAIGKSESAVSQQSHRLRKRLRNRKRQDDEWRRSVDLELKFDLAAWDSALSPPVWQQVTLETETIPESTGWTIHLVSEIENHEKRLKKKDKSTYGYGIDSGHKVQPEDESDLTLLENHDAASELETEAA